MTVASRTSKINSNPRKLSLIAAYALLGMIVFVGLAEGFALSGILVQGDASTTAENVAANLSSFNLGLFFHAMVIVLDIVAAWALYYLLKPSAPRLSMSAAVLRVLYALFYAVGVIQLASAINNDAVHAFNSFRQTWDLGFIVFGAHLLVLGVALLKYQPLPKWLAWLILLGGVSYLFDYVTLFLLGATPVKLSVVFGFGEIGLMIWLFWKGGKHE